MNSKRVLIAFMGLFSFAGICWGFDSSVVLKSITDYSDQSVLSGKIESLNIRRGPAEFRLGKGQITLFDYGTGKPATMVFKGKGQFLYYPPDEVERYQLRKFTKSDSLSEPFEEIALFFTAPIENLPDTSLFVRTTAKEVWEYYQTAISESFEHLGINVATRLMMDLLSNDQGTFFAAYLESDRLGQLVFQEDPTQDDIYSLFKLNIIQGIRMCDVYCGFSPDHSLISQRGVMDIDISHYDILSKIESDGHMVVNCHMVFEPLRLGRQLIYLQWFPKNRIISATDGKGHPVTVLNKEKEPGLGLLFPKPLMPGAPDSVDIVFECKAVSRAWDVFYIKAQSSWYPRNISQDRATYRTTYDCPKSLQVIGCGDPVESHIEGKRLLSTWEMKNQVAFVSFNIGVFDSKEVDAPGVPPVKVFLSKYFPHTELALLLSEWGINTSYDMLGNVGVDVANSLLLFSSLMGPCIFDTIRVTEIPGSFGQGSPSLIHLSWEGFQSEGLSGGEIQFRSHETAHQWWGNVVDVESYRDYWIIEGMAEYYGFLFYEISAKDPKKSDLVLSGWAEAIFGGVMPMASGSSAGPPVMGHRLISPQNNDYQTIVYDKGAYIFHMIRYLLHDYSTGSDDLFINFMRNLSMKYRNKPLTTEKFKKELENQVGENLDWFFDEWVYGTDVPIYSYSFTSRQLPEGDFQTGCYVIQENVKPDFQALIPLKVEFEGGQYAYVPIKVDRSDAMLELPRFAQKPQNIVFNVNQAVLCKVKKE